MQTQKFVGPRAVSQVVIDEMKTYGGNEIVNVHYDGGHVELMSKRTFELVATEEAKDFNYVRETKFAELKKSLYPIVARIIARMGESEEVKGQVRTTGLQEILAEISEIDIKDSEQKVFFDSMSVEFIGLTNAVMFELSNEFARATNWLFTKDDKQFVPGMDVMHDRTYLEMKKVVATIPKTNESVESPKAE